MFISQTNLAKNKFANIYIIYVLISICSRDSSKVHLIVKQTFYLKTDLKSFLNITLRYLIVNTAFYFLAKS
ncbi:hypothetical protein CLOSTASPAR_00672 [[Clostridium] asparagiforme DSM 15981]|uniref:Uncharacterized protein n=1 Tax=[Clostridium] asparagiforme DSM 15981 TaxID=518636 RepID=C0CUI0_9FIRM|nr:hypothetical protein CLOSTASPAR_00672 [[Clostridium] asparagiforme DSM 15981]